MTAKAKPVPEGYHALTPCLCVEGAAEAIDFYKTAFGASELLRVPGPDGKVAHAELRIGDSVLMLCDPQPGLGVRGPRALGGSPVHLNLYIAGVDEVVARALAAGAKLRRPVADQFYGDRSGLVEDPFGHVWHVSTHVEDLSPEEIDRRAKAWSERGGAPA